MRESAPDAADALAMALEPPAPLIIGVDLARDKDMSAIAMVERTMSLGVMISHMRAVRTGRWANEDEVHSAYAAMVRDYHRPSGYSRSHWRKLWKQNVHG